MSKGLEKYARNLKNFVLTHDEDDDVELVETLVEQERRIRQERKRTKANEQSD